MSAPPKYMAVQGAAIIVAAALTVIGILGFVPGITAHLDQIAWAGKASGALLFGTFSVSVIVNVVHIVVGLCGFALARTYASARAYLLGGGAIYVGLGLYGMLADRGSHVLPLNSAANWLHFTIGAVMLILAVTLAGQHDPTRRRRVGLRRAAT
ncbi:DUF4383 domain-containing protein [Mycobacterium sp. SMC-4]|uniref:DUF4383 domain-containing protein n=1 Tax=Mycobacterium sp. SMC-4 TaxID=2857059 RepID=UPI003D029FD9